MSTSVFAYTYFAIEAPYSAFFATTGEMRRTCPAYPDGHPLQATAKFCDQCGHRAEDKAVEKPTEAFTAFCAEREVDPDYAFHQLREEGWEWSDEAGNKHTIGFYRVQAVNQSIPDPAQTVTALGIQLGTAYLREMPNVLAYTIEDLQKLVGPVQEMAEAFRITGTPKLYAQAYWSY